MDDAANPVGPRALRVADADDVAVALAPLSAGETVMVGQDAVRLVDAIGSGHKFALHPIAAGGRVHRYQAPIGIATRAIARGEHVHSHNLKTALGGEREYRFVAPAAVRERCKDAPT